jgi:glycosyltransferase involved in cell wall biosynthesis
MSKPKILYLLHSYFTQGGTELHTRDLALGLDDVFETYVVYPKPGHVVLVRNDRPIATYPSDVPWSPFSPVSTTLTDKTLTTLLRTIEPDVIHIHHIMYWPLSIIDRLTAHGCPVIMTFHDYFVITPLPTLQFGEVEETLTREYSERVFQRDHSSYLLDRRHRLSDSLAALSLRIAPSSFAAQEIRKAFPLDFRVVQHGIHPFEVTRHCPSESVRFAFLGNLIPQKGWELLLRAFPEVRARHPSAELHIFGWSPQPVRAGVPGVFVHGPYKREALADIFSAVDVGIIPSVFKETFGYVLSEMWHASLPVAVANIGALGERVTDGANGKTFAPSSIEAIRNAMYWFLENDGWKSWILPKPRLVSDMLAEYERIYRDLVDGTIRS